MDERRLLGTKAAADRLGVSPWTLYRWAAQRRLPTIKLGGKSLYDPRDLDQFVAQHRVPAREMARIGRAQGR